MQASGRRSPLRFLRPGGAALPLATSFGLALRIALSCAIALLIFATMLRGGGDRAFSDDWLNHLWLVAKQAEFVRANILPTFFVNTTNLGYFYPYFAFYGGTLYYTTALVSIVVDSPWAAYVGTYVMGAVVSINGWTWLSRQASVRGWCAFLPGMVFTCAPYVLTNAYGRGAWPEYIAVCTLPMVLAASWSLLTKPVGQPRTVFALIVSVVFLTGSHTITLGYGSLFLVAALAAAAVLRGLHGIQVGRLGLLILAWALGVGVNAWFVVPLLRFRSQIALGTPGLDLRDYDQLSVIFSLVPKDPLAWKQLGIYVQTPVIPLVASLTVLAIGLLLLRSRALLAKTIATLFGFAALLVLITDTSHIWPYLPSDALFIQFPYRLNTYVAACVAVLTLIAVLCAQGLRMCSGPWSVRAGACGLAILALAAMAQLAIGVRQARTARDTGSAEEVLSDLAYTPSSWYDQNYFSGVVPALPQVDAQLPIDGQETGNLRLRPTDRPLLVGTDIVPSALVSFEPDLLIGQMAGHAVLLDPVSEHPTDVRVTPSHSLWTVGGAAISILSLVGSAGLTYWSKRRAEQWPRQGVC